jgi:hypothetical protein
MSGTRPELQEVLDRYGLVVFGFSVSDEAIGRLAGVYETLIAVCLDVRERSGRRANDGACSGNRPTAMM